MALLLPAGGDQKSTLSPVLQTLVNSEREFASTSLKEGIRASFLKYFAADGISMSPKPHVYRESALKTAPPADPLARTLYWEPIVADVSSSGDLGYTIGPASLKEKAKQEAPVWYGFYFSIWKKQPDGAWKVAVDAGTTSTKVVEQYFGKEPVPALHSSFKPGAKTAKGKAAERELINRDKAFSKTVAARGVSSAYEKILDPQARALREGLVPLDGKTAILAYLVKGTALRFLEPMHAGVSKAADMGYTYGAYRQKINAKSPSGYYVHVWRRDSKGTWVVVVETASLVE
jgi:ketosteroid isomerase-like protein